MPLDTIEEVYEHEAQQMNRLIRTLQDQVENLNNCLAIIANELNDKDLAKLCRDGNTPSPIMRHIIDKTCHEIKKLHRMVREYHEMDY
tara:strand:- start:1094 stop:1357 length:264 start_codon:yes stop_codon:yes gene_type:complete